MYYKSVSEVYLNYESVHFECIIFTSWLGSQCHASEYSPSPSLLMKRWINYVMFISLWLIADNDVWEVCQMGEHTRLPSAVGPRSGCVHLTNEMSHGEEGPTRTTKRSLQLIPLHLLIVQTAPNSERNLCGLPTDHITLRVHSSVGYLAVGRHLGLVWLHNCVICSQEKITVCLWSLLVTECSWWSSLSSSL